MRAATVQAIPRFSSGSGSPALLLDVYLTDAAYYVKRGPIKSRLQDMIDAARAVRRDIEELQNELVEKAETA
jgi:hypothetical protein